MKVFLVILLLLLLIVPVVAAQDDPGYVAPIQVEFAVDGHIVVYDCYPMGVNDDPEMVVYVNCHDGIAAYACTWTSDTQVMPVPVLPNRNEYAWSVK